jgi:subtilisin family serine protease
VLWNGDVARAIQHAVDNDCHVISMSLGGLGSEAIEEAVNDAVDRGVIVLAAAGNQVSFVVAPANYPRCIAVAACNVDRRPWRGSAHGKAVAITAPGENVWVAQPARPAESNNRCDPGSGTSYAVAATAGAAALWLAHHGRDTLLDRYRGSRTLQDVFRELVQQTAARPPQWDPRNYGPGILDVDALLQAPLPAATRSFRRLARRDAQARTAVERLGALYDDAPSASVKAALQAILKTRSRSPLGDLERHATETLHIVGTDPAAYAAFAELLDSKPRVRRSTARSGTMNPTSRVRELLADRASDHLAQAMLGYPA